MSARSEASCIALRCDRHGLIREILRHEVDITPPPEVGRPFALAADTASRAEAARFIDAVSQRGAVFDWQLDFRSAAEALGSEAESASSGSRVVLLRFSGIAAGDDLIIAGATASEDVEHLCESLAAIGNEGANRLRQALQEQADQRRRFEAQGRQLELLRGIRSSSDFTGRGSTLRVSLPAPEVEACRVAAKPTPLCRRLEILVAEDSPPNQELVRRLLERRGHRVTIADDGCAALRALAVKRFDLILMDVEMPGMSGLEATAAIRAAETASGGHVPIVGLTARTEAEGVDRCLAMGMDACVRKPLDVKQLMRAIEGAVGRQAVAC